MSDQIDIAKVYEGFSGPLKAFIQKRVHDPALAEDLMHDVFVKIHDRVGSLREQEKLTSWIYQIARNAITDSYRKRKEMVEPQDVAIEDSKQLNDIPERLARSLRAMTEQLPAKYKEALLLADFEGIKQTDLAERLGFQFRG